MSMVGLRHFRGPPLQILSYCQDAGDCLSTLVQCIGVPSNEPPCDERHATRALGRQCSPSLVLGLDGRGTHVARHVSLKRSGNSYRRSMEQAYCNKFFLMKARICELHSLRLTPLTASRTTQSGDASSLHSSSNLNNLSSAVATVSKLPCMVTVFAIVAERNVGQRVQHVAQDRKNARLPLGVWHADGPLVDIMLSNAMHHLVV